VGQNVYFSGTCAAGNKYAGTQQLLPLGVRGEYSLRKIICRLAISVTYDGVNVMFML